MEEIKNVIQSLPSNKSPGPDGFTWELYKATWGILGNQLAAAVQEFFITGTILKEINATAITLVPKCLQPSKVTDYRPISCFNIYFLNVLQKSLLIG